MPEKKIIFKNLFDLISTVILGAWIGFALWATGNRIDNQTRIYAENGPIENAQACLLAISCIVYLATAALEKKSQKLVLLSCSLLCYGFALREMDVEKFDIPYVLKFIGSGVGRNMTIVMAYVALCAYATLRNFDYYKKAVAGFFRSRPGVLLTAGCVFMLAGGFFEKFKSIVHRAYFEEITELFGYVLILLSSLATSSFLCDKGRSLRKGRS